jgi:MFS family permease
MDETLVSGPGAQTKSFAVKEGEAGRQATPPGSGDADKASISAWYGLGVLIAATLLSFVDREILSLVAEPLRISLGMTDTQLGLLQGVGMVFFAGLASLPIAWIADRFGRRVVLVASVLIWCAATAGCGLARTFDELFVAMVFLGIGQAGLGPVVFGLIPDLFPARQRILANMLYSLVATLGAALGLVAGGPLVSAIDGARAALPPGLQGYESWRLAFFMVATPGPVMALLVFSMRMRPRPGVAAVAGVDSAESRISALEYVRTQLGTVVGLFGSIGLVGFGFNAIGAWSPIVAARNFGATPTDVGQGLGLAMGVGTILGGLLVTPAARRLGPRYGIATSLRLIEIGLVVALPLCLGMAFVTSSTQLFVLICLQVAPVTIGSMLFNTAMQDVSPAYLRSQVLAIGMIATLLFSTTSPLVVGMLSDAMKPSPSALLWAMVVVGLVGLGLGALLMRWSEASFVKTVRTFTPDPAVGA